MEQSDGFAAIVFGGNNSAVGAFGVRQMTRPGEFQLKFTIDSV